MKWTTKLLYYDVETGEIISKWEAKDNYIIIKKNKYARLNTESFRGTITYEYACRRKDRKQGELF